ncbi:hypothetical protein HK096_000009 [Nowakowskiella sp. JEL0078]|nr:hypothetical protein HK096_000009 [Nowakowskiella sp. JEL0078]
MVSEHFPDYRRPSSDTEFGSYLAGLIEGDGHFGKFNQIVISFHLKDIRLAYWIKSMIGYGKVRLVPNKQAVTYYVGKRAGVLKVLDLINGKIRTTYKYNQLLSNFKSSYTLNLLPLDISPLISNAWLAGFIDADGSFQIKVLNRAGRKLPEPQILELIKGEFGGYIGYRASQDTYYYQSVSFPVAYSFIIYVRTYHLLSYKYISYRRWAYVYLLIQKGLHLTDAGIALILRIKNLLNS